MPVACAVSLTAAAFMIGVIVAFSTTAFVIGVVVLAAASILLVATASTAFSPSVATTAAAAGMVEHFGRELRYGFKLSRLELGQGFGGGFGFAAEDLDAVFLQIEQQMRVHLAAEYAADLGDSRLRDRARLGAVERFELPAFAVEDQQVAGGAEVSGQFGFQAFRAGDGDAEFHVAVSLRSGGFGAGAGWQMHRALPLSRASAILR